ncbi:MAG: RDD family protein [Bacilli bacterium]|jgi:hypothetical protein
MNKKEYIPPAVVEKPEKKLPKPYLITRIGASFLDFLMIFIIFAGFEALTYFTLFEPLGYHALIDEAHQVLSDSHLYSYDSAKGYSTITEAYNEDLTPEENYDVPIVYYYSQDARALQNDRLALYYNEKTTSTYFVEESEGIFARAGNATDDEIRTFLASEYDKAIAFLEDDPVYLNGIQKSFYIVIFSVLINATLATGIIHLLIPMLMKNGQTPFKLVFKLALVDNRDETRAKRWQIVVRFSILISFNIWIPILLFAKFTYFTLIPVFATIIMMSLTKTYSGPHDYFSKTYIVSSRDITIPESQSIIESDS